MRSVKILYSLVSGIVLAKVKIVTMLFWQRGQKGK